MALQVAGMEKINSMDFCRASVYRIEFCRASVYRMDFCRASVYRANFCLYEPVSWGFGTINRALPQMRNFYGVKPM